MKLNLNNVITTVLFLTGAALFLRNAGPFNTIIRTGGGWITQNLALLSGAPITDVASLAPKAPGLFG